MATADMGRPVFPPTSRRDDDEAPPASTKATFTAEERAELAGLHGKVKKKRVAELKAKHRG